MIHDKITNIMASTSLEPQIQATRVLTMLSWSKTPGIWKSLPTALLQELQEMFYPLMTRKQVLARLRGMEGWDAEITAYPSGGRETYPVRCAYPESNGDVLMDYLPGYAREHISYRVDSHLIFLEYAAMIKLMEYKKTEADVRFVLRTHGKVIAYGECDRRSQCQPVDWLLPGYFERMRAYDMQEEQESGVMRKEMVEEILEGMCACTLEGEEEEVDEEEDVTSQ